MRYNAIYLTLDTVKADPANPQKQNVGKTFADITFLNGTVPFPDENDFARSLKFLKPEQIAFYHKLVKQVNPNWTEAQPVTNIDISSLGLFENKQVFIEDFEKTPFILYKRGADGKTTTEPITSKDGTTKIYTQLKVLIDIDADGNPKTAPNNEARRMIDQLGKFITGSIAPVQEPIQQIIPPMPEEGGLGATGAHPLTQ